MYRAMPRFARLARARTIRCRRLSTERVSDDGAPWRDARARRHLAGDGASADGIRSGALSGTTPVGRRVARIGDTAAPAEDANDNGDGGRAGRTSSGVKIAQLVCPSCRKPNVLATRRCTKCGARLSEEHAAAVHADPFGAVLDGSRSDHRLLFRDERVFVVGDLFPSASIHLLAIPVEPLMCDASALGREHLPLVAALLDAAERVLARLSPGCQPVAGFNVPATISRLHMHVAVPPFTYPRGFGRPNFHPWIKVHRDIVALGRLLPHNGSRCLGPPGDRPSISRP